MQQEVYLSERKRITNRLEVQGQQRQNVMTYFWHCSVLINCTYSSNLLKYWLVQGTIFFILGIHFRVTEVFKPSTAPQSY